MIDQLNEFFDSPGINKRGICIEAGISQQHLNRVLKGRSLTESFKRKLLPVAEKYGFKYCEHNTQPRIPNPEIDYRVCTKCGKRLHELKD